MVLKTVSKRPKLQTQTSQFEMTIHADDGKLGGYVLVRICPRIQIYQILYKQTTTLNRLLKATIKTSPLNLQRATPRVHFASTKV